MSHQGVSEGAFLVFLDPSVPLLVGLLLVALVLFARWLETGDRSAYAVGAAAAALAPLWIVVDLFDSFVLENLSPVPSGLGNEPLFAWAVGWVYWGLGLVLVVALLWFTLWPLIVTRFFLFTPQALVRRRYKSLESSWQYGIAALLVAKALWLAFQLLEHTV